MSRAVALCIGAACVGCGIVSLYKFLWQAYFAVDAQDHIGRDLLRISFSGVLIVSGGLLLIYGFGGM